MEQVLEYKLREQRRHARTLFEVLMIKNNGHTPPQKYVRNVEMGGVQFEEEETTFRTPEEYLIHKQEKEVMRELENIRKGTGTFMENLQAFDGLSDEEGSA